MRRWSSSFPIPAHYGFQGSIRCTTIGKNIWFTKEKHSKNEESMDMWVFDTETKQITQVKCSYDGDAPGDATNLSSDGKDTIYMFKKTAIAERTVFRLDIHTLIWTKSVTIPYPVWWGAFEASEFAFATIGNQLYMVLDHEYEELVRVDVSTDEVTRWQIREEFELYNYFACTNEENLYLIEHGSYYRTVYTFENGVRIEVAKDKYASEEVAPVYMKRDFAGSILYCCKDQEHLYFEKFDFETKKWNRTDVERCWYEENFSHYDNKIQFACEIGDQIFIAVDSSDSYKKCYEFRVLELNPSLSTRCLFSLVDQLMMKSENEVDQVKDKLQIHLRDKLTNMLEWRVTAKLQEIEMKRDKSNDPVSSEEEESEKEETVAENSTHYSSSDESESNYQYSYPSNDNDAEYHREPWMDDDYWKDPKPIGIPYSTENMLRWSFSIPIPIECKSADELHCVKVGKTIWFTSQYSITEKRMDLIVYDTETGKYAKIKCKFDGEKPTSIIHLARKKKAICIWTSNCDDEYEENYVITMFKLDIDTFEWRRSAKFEVSGMLASDPQFISILSIIKNHMCLMIKSREFTELVRINLSNDEVSRCRMKESYYLNPDGRMMMNKGRLYWVDHDDDRKVYLIENGEKIEVAKDEYMVKRHFPKILKNDFAGGLLYQSGRSDRSQLSFEKFNFETKQWRKRAIEVCWYDHHLEKMHSAVEIDEKVYVAVSGRDGLEFRVLELNPSLSTRCLLSLVDDIMPKTSYEIYRIYNKLPVDLWRKLSDMREWRVNALREINEQKTRWMKSDKRRKKVEEQMKKKNLEDRSRNMLRWSSSIRIPVHSKCLGNIKCTTIGKDIWFSTSDRKRKEGKRYDMMVLNTESQRISKIKCTYDGEPASDTFWLTYKDNIIYMWRNAIRARDDGATLYKLDMTTLVWTKGISVHIPHMNFPSAITNYSLIGNRMYMIVEYRDVEILTLDLSTDKMTQSKLKDGRNYGNFITLVNDDKLYLVEHTDEHRIISLIDNGTLIEVLKDDYRIDGYYAKAHKTDLPGKILYKYFDGGLENLCFDSFDFETNKWNRKHVERCWQDPEEIHDESTVTIRSCCEVDGRIYAVYNPNLPNQSEYNFFRVLELNPDLSTRCLFTLVDELVTKSTNEVEKVTNLLPFCLRDKLSNMVLWRSLELKKLRKIGNKKRNNHKPFFYTDEVLTDDSSAGSDTDSSNGIDSYGYDNDSFEGYASDDFDDWRRDLLMEEFGMFY